jgi:hypothetical protein
VGRLMDWLEEQGHLPRGIVASLLACSFAMGMAAAAVVVLTVRH